MYIYIHEVMHWQGMEGYGNRLWKAMEVTVTAEPEYMGKNRVDSLPF